MSTSSINFEAAYDNAVLRVAADALKEWIEGHPYLPYFTFDQICRELGHVAPAEHFNRVLLRLVAAGELRVAYRVKISEDEYSEEAFDSFNAVPSCVFDSAFEPHAVSDDAKVPAYSAAK